MDIFERRLQNYGPIGKWAEKADGYFMFPKLEGEISNRMIFRGKEKLVWSLNNYLGLANHPEVRQTDAEATAKYGLAYPMGARMMSGQTEYHQQLENELAAFVQKEASYLLNFGYQGMVSIIDSLIDRKDVVVYDSESHACIIDGLRMHLGKRFVFQHNDIGSFEKQLKHAQHVAEQTGGGILVISEGVFGMAGDLGKIDKIAGLKKKYNFRLLVDDAHGFGTMGATGIGTGEAQGVQDQIDVYFSTFAKSMAGIGAFVASDKNIISYLQHNMRSQIYAKSLPMPLVLGSLKRLELLKTQPQLREKLWTIVNALQHKLRENDFNLGRTESPVTPVFLNGGIPEAAQLTYELREKYNVFCSIVAYPVVPKDVLMLRLIPTAVHTLDDVEETVNAFIAVRNNLQSGKYDKKFFPDISMIQ
ncbi:MAG: aminotransferase class I/II-fold pyridoxal phosphate-dependent enzyme [Bacteroidales bacterium]|nr:aminotransferase class I/II-fold pyridoxal phosphate-dependent enzyme [Bacteroidales bacterium]MDZ4204474.1 aminotransferase class I/II-fold pyridoxal phosphate-dependent enzyme [Bacteroidales bacterium]